jgi:hypothetical protein
MVKQGEQEENLGLAIRTREREFEGSGRNIWRGGDFLSYRDDKRIKLGGYCARATQL